MAITPAHRAASKKWRDKNKEHERRRNAEYWAKHRDELRKKAMDRWRIRYARNSGVILDRNREWRRAHKETMREIHRKRYVKNRDQMLAYQKQRRVELSKNPDWKSKQLKRNRDAYKKDKQSKLAKNKQWRDNNRAYYAARRHHRRALEKQASVNLKGIKAWMRSVRKSPFATCYYCQVVIPSRTVHFDHIVPLSKGGEHSVANLCVSCSSCNLSKGYKNIRAWVKVGQQMLEL